jgi:hypothetical protein
LTVPTRYRVWETKTKKRNMADGCPMCSNSLESPSIYGGERSTQTDYVAVVANGKLIIYDLGDNLT